VWAELIVDMKKLYGAMVGDGWSKCAVAGAVMATVDIKKGDEIVVGINMAVSCTLSLKVVESSGKGGLGRPFFSR